MNTSKFLKTSALVFGAVMLVAASSCDTQPSAAEQANAQNVAARDDVLARATAAVPVPRVTNFQARENLSEFMQRVDREGHVWYVYERAPMTGEILGVYTSSSYPQSVCTFMTPPDEVHLIETFGDTRSGVVVNAIALDGVYYEGGDCPDFFFDYTTGAMIILDADAVTIAVDQPLEVDTPSFSFVVENTEE